jgi:hypothetical protein
MMYLMMIQTFRKRPTSPLLEQFAIADFKDSHASEAPRLAIL